MSWQGILGHDEVVEQFRRALERGRLASSFLFVGPEGVGKRTFAVKLAQAMLCNTRAEAALDPCGTCEACVQVTAGSHPDLEIVAKPKDKSFLPVDLLIGDREHRMQVGLLHHIGLKPFMGGRKIAVIDTADFLNVEGANCLLKTLEEPPPRSILILIGTSPAKQLPTIRSRCQLIRFKPLPNEFVARLLLEQEIVTDPDEAERLAGYSGGSLRRAIEMADADLWAFRGRLYERLAEPVLDSVPLAKTLAEFVDSAGREASDRRQRMRQVIGFTADFYRQMLHRQSDMPAEEDAELQAAIDRALPAWPVDASITGDCLDRCLLAAEQVNRNANQTTLLESWLDDLARLLSS